MPKLKYNCLNLIVMLAVCVGSAFLGFALGSNTVNSAKTSKAVSLQQSDEKAVITAEQPDDPLKFGNQLRVKGVRIAMGRKFSATSIAQRGRGQVEDWLDSLEFSLTNKSPKHITYIHLELQFPDTEVNGLLMVYRELAVGVPPKLSGDQLRYGEPLDLSPGNTFTFALSTKDLQQIKDFLALRKFELFDLSSVVVQVLTVVFDDETKWTLGGSYFRPNPAVRGGYERVNQ